MTIAVLDDKLINKIAAGEVVERPASIVKELVENSIDAGSSIINVNISGGGIERIEIQDNGQGIADNEVALAFQRHATSKIINEADLFSIKSMGFRGEALPSIASIARIELFTRSASGTGMHLVIYGGLIQELEPYPTPAGTKIIVKDVFYNTPARRKFLKTPVSENLYIYDIMSKLALSRPDISFSFSNEKKNYFKTPGNGKLLDALTSIYGRDYTSNFLPVDWSGDKYALHGLISKPDFHRINRKNQVFFVNCRLIRSPLLSRQLMRVTKDIF
jgi:DNA mismatch repair protein MutL